jgi:hypothetical protein
MKCSILIAALSVVLFTLSAQTIQWDWAVSAGGISTDQGLSIARDAGGNLYVAGSFAQAASFGPIELTSNGGYDIFVAKMSSTGEWLWAVNAGGSVSDYAYGLVLDSEANCYITGRFDGTASFGTTEVTSNGASDVYIAKLSSAGEWQWAIGAGGSSTGLECSYGIGLDSAKNCYITGPFFDSATFGDHTISSVGGYDAFVAKLSADGSTWQWAIRAGNSSADMPYSIAVDAAGNSYSTGYFDNTASFGDHDISSAGSTDIYVAKASPSGTWLWAARAGSSSYTEQGNGVCLDADGNVYVSGTFREVADFGGTNLTSAGDVDSFAAKLDNDGNWLWAKSAGGSTGDYCYGIAPDASANIYITGTYSSDANFGEHVLAPSGSMSLYAAKLDSEGNWLWAIPASSGKGESIIADNAGTCYLTGNFTQYSTFGSTTLESVSYESYWGTTHSQDIFVAKLGSEEDDTLPVELSSFTAISTSSGQVMLNWETASETEVAGYHVYRSQEVQDFATAILISDLIPATNTSQTQSYSYPDIEICEAGQYYYWLQSCDYDGSLDTFGPVMLNYELGGDEPDTPDITFDTRLKSVFPNPFNPMLVIPYYLAEDQDITIRIHNIKGQLVKTFDIGNQASGEHRVIWDGKNEQGASCSTGMYYISFDADTRHQVQKAIMMK